MKTEHRGKTHLSDLVTTRSSHMSTLGIEPGSQHGEANTLQLHQPDHWRSRVMYICAYITKSCSFDSIMSRRAASTMSRRAASTMSRRAVSTMSRRAVSTMSRGATSTMYRGAPVQCLKAPPLQCLKAPPVQCHVVPAVQCIVAPSVRWGRS